MNLNILLNLFLIVGGGGLFFFLGYVKGTWDRVDRTDKHVADVVLHYEQEIRKLRSKLYDDGDGWKV